MSDFLSFIAVEHIWFFHGATQFLFDSEDKAKLLLPLKNLCKLVLRPKCILRSESCIYIAYIYIYCIYIKTYESDLFIVSHPY